MKVLTALALSLMVLFGPSTGAKADEADARKILKSMSDYMAAQTSISFGFDTTLETVTTDEQKLALASSGNLILNRPDKIRVTRTGEFADVDMSFDGKVLTVLGKNLNLYTQIEVPGTIDHLIDELKDTYNRPLPAADLLLLNFYDEVMQNVVDVKDLGSCVVGGVRCDHLAFRTEDVDWQIWLAEGDHPCPRRYVITSKLLSGGPQYTFQVRDWQIGDKVAATDFNFTNQSKADKAALKDLKGIDDLPDYFKKGDAK